MLEILFPKNTQKEISSSEGKKEVDVAVKYNEQGNIIEKSYFDKNGKTTVHEEGYAKIKLQYDKQGNVSEVAYFDMAGNPYTHEDGYAKVTMEYDNQRNVNLLAYFAADGAPCLNKENIAKAIRKYDERGNILDEVFFGIKGEFLTPVVFGEIIKDGNANKNGLQGNILILRFCEWEIDNKHTELSSVIERNREKRKILIFLNNGKIEEQEFGAGLIGIRFHSQLKDIKIFEEAKTRYKAWKPERNKTSIVK
jgi:hypothetical protein